MCLSFKHESMGSMPRTMWNAGHGRNSGEVETGRSSALLTSKSSLLGDIMGDSSSKEVGRVFKMTAKAFFFNHNNRHRGMKHESIALPSLTAS